MLVFPHFVDMSEMIVSYLCCCRKSAMRRSTSQTSIVRRQKVSFKNWSTKNMCVLSIESLISKLTQLTVHSVDQHILAQ